MRLIRRSLAVFGLAGWTMSMGIPRTASAEQFPLLEEMNRQTQSMYRQVQGGIVRVQLPVPKWVRDEAEKDDPMKKWGQVVDPEVAQKIKERQEENYRGGVKRISAAISPTTQPTTVPTGWQARRNGAEIVLDSRGAGQSIVIYTGGTHGKGSDIGGVLRPRDGGFAANNIGLILDEQGHMMVPLYIERETVGDGGVKVMIEDRETTASFVGSDQKTNVTVLKLNERVGRALKMSGQRPGDGAMVMLLNPNGGSGRLVLWTGGERDYGVVVGMDGAVAGIVRYGQFVGGDAYAAVVQQLIKVGTIQRAVLGARLTELPRDNPLRIRLAELGDRPAILIEEVVSGSLADRSGLRSGDLIMQLGNSPIGDLTTWAALTATGGRQKVVVLRDGKTAELHLDLTVE